MRKNRVFFAVAGGHFTIDLLNSTGAVLLAVLKEPLGLSYAQIGTALTLYLLIGSLSQPLFGWLSDKVQGRVVFLAGSVLWMALCFTLVALAPSWTWLLPVFLLAPLGSGLFHPIGTAAVATAAPERAASATSLFFFAGQVGLATGPFLAGTLAGRFGALGLLPLAVFALIPAAILLLARRDERAFALQPKAASTQRATRVRTNAAIALVVAFVVLVALRASIQAVYQAYLPQLFQSRGWDPTLFGLMAGVFMAAGAVGQVITGNLADRYGIRAAVLWPLLLSIPTGLFCLLTPSVGLAFVACAAAGFLIGGQHSVLVVHAQQLLPVKQGFAAGLILGFNFASGAIGTWFAGQIADSAGLQPVMVWMTLLGLPAAALALTLPGQPRCASSVVPAAAPAGD